MKKTLLILVFAVISFTSLFSQRIAEDKIDDFNHKHIIRTSWGEFDYSFLCSGWVRYNKIDSVTYLTFSMMNASEWLSTIEEGNNFYLKFADSTVMTLPVMEKAYTTIGGGAKGMSGSKTEGFMLNLLVTKESKEQILSKPVVKIRIQTTEGHIDKAFNEAKDQRLKAILKLID